MANEIAERPVAPGIKVVKDFMKSLNDEPAAIAPPAAPVTTPETPPAPVETPEPKPVTPAPPAAPATDDDYEKVLADTTIPRNKQNWDKRIAAEHKRLAKKDAEIASVTKQLSEVQEQIKIFKPGSVDGTELASLKKERDEYSERLRVLDIQNHPKFKAHYDGKINAQIQLAKRIVGAENGDQLAELLKLPDTSYRQNQIEELVSSLSPMQASRIGTVLNSLSEIEVDRQQQIDAAKTDFDRMQSESKAKAEKQAKELEQTQEALFNETLANQTKLNFMFQKKEGQDEWNKSVDERASIAKGLLFNERDPNRLAMAAFYASAFPDVVNSHVQANERIAALEKQVKDLSAAQPKISGEPKESPASTPSASRKPKNYLGGMEQAKGWIDNINRDPEAVE